MTLPTYTQTKLQLPAMGAWPASWHCFDEQQRHALRAAEAAGRPLLVRGEPGTGKSQLAHAAAVASERQFLSVVVDARTEARDLQWRFDAVARLADAHLAALPGSTGGRALNPEHYLSPGPLWWALDWKGAECQHNQLRHQGCAPQVQPKGWTPAKGCVLLIDEIDKADTDFPNSLLEVLGNGRFSVDPLSRVVERGHEVPPPLIIITTNDERELPAAFLRRCLVLTLALPTEPGALLAHLVERGTLHFPQLARHQSQVLHQAAEMLVSDRQTARAQGCYVPGLAEYLDLLRVLATLGGDSAAHLATLRQFVFDKQPRT